jgi:ribosomal protein L37AE/L43A
MRLWAELGLLSHASDTPSAAIKTTRHGLPVTIEHPKGSTRVLHDDKGNEVYRRRMFHAYGFFDSTRGRDGDEVDCLLGPNPNAKSVYVIHMKDMGPDPSEREDEDKCMVGFDSGEAAKQAFFLHYAKNFFGGMTELSVADFKKKMKTASLPHRRKKITAREVPDGSHEKCPKCGSKRYGLMPTDFETAKCNKCGKTWTINAGGPGSGRHAEFGRAAALNDRFFGHNRSDKDITKMAHGYAANIANLKAGPKHDDAASEYAQGYHSGLSEKIAASALMDFILGGSGGYPLPRRSKSRVGVAISAIAHAFCLLLCLFLPLVGQPLPISGTVKYPDGTNVTGTYKIVLTRPSVRNACVTPAQVLTYSPVTVAVTNGALGTVSLFSSVCNVPSITQPTIIPSSGAGMGATVSNVSFSDLQGSVLLTTGTKPSAGQQFVILFGQNYSGYPSPVCVVEFNAGMTYKSTPSSIAFSSPVALSPSTTYTVGYWCGLEPYSVTLTDNNKKVLYSGKWVVPEFITAIDLSTLDPRY